MSVRVLMSWVSVQLTLISSLLRRQLLATPMARHPAFPSSRTSFVRRPFVRRAFRVRGFAALPCDGLLLLRVHRCEPTIFLTHVSFFLEPSSPRLVDSTSCCANH